jgi:hypothetical protein
MEPLPGFNIINQAVYLLLVEPLCGSNLAGYKPRSGFTNDRYDRQWNSNPGGVSPMIAVRSIQVANRGAVSSMIDIIIIQIKNRGAVSPIIEVLSLNEFKPRRGFIFIFSSRK